MLAISAADAVSLAVQRTRDFLFRPFQWGSYLKLCLVAIITEGLFSNPSFTSHHERPSGHGETNLEPLLHFPTQWIIAAVFAVALVLVIALAIFYLVTRLRFAYFHCLIHNTRALGPGWLFYREQARRFFLLNVTVGFCYFVMLALTTLPFLSSILRLIREAQQGGHPDIGLALSVILPLMPILLLYVLAGVVADIVLRDWMMPHYALDNATAGEAWARVRGAMSAEKRQFVVYTILRLILPTVAMVAVFMILIVPGLALAGSLAAVEFGLHSAFADASGSSALVGTLLEVFFGFVAVAFAVVLGICIGGPLSTGIREYALVFYGGRYPTLGNILYPPTPSGAV